VRTQPDNDNAIRCLVCTCTCSFNVILPFFLFLLLFLFLFPSPDILLESPLLVLRHPEAHDQVPDRVIIGLGDAPLHFLELSGVRRVLDEVDEEERRAARLGSWEAEEGRIVAALFYLVRPACPGEPYPELCTDEVKVFFLRPQVSRGS